MRKLRIKPFLAGKNWKRVLILSLCFALLAGTVSNASAFHLLKVKNKSFEKDGNKDGIPNRWTPDTLNAKSKRVCNKSKHKKCSFRMRADGNPQVLAQDILDSSGSLGIEATISVWVRGKDLVGAGTSNIVLYFVQNLTVQPCVISIPQGSFGWTKFEATCVSSEAFSDMTIHLSTSEGSGKLWFDKVKLSAICLIC